jgi:hypothetical protein
MRAIDDPIPVYIEILQLLQHWGPLPESDVSRMLRQWMLVTNDFREMEEQGYIEMSFTGDEYLISMTVLGRLFLEQEQASDQR